MPEQPSSLVALRLTAPVTDVAALLSAARAAGAGDRTAPLLGGAEAAEAHWGGRIQRAVVRTLVDEDGAHLLRTEVAVAADGLVAGAVRQAFLLQALVAPVRAAGPDVAGVRDLSARVDRELGWLDRLATGGVVRADVVTSVVEPAAGRRPGWIRTHGAARFGVPDLELYGLPPGAEVTAEVVLGHVHDALLAGGMAAPLALPDGTPVRLVPVLEAWARLPMDWPGLGRAGATRGPGLDGPRATLSVLHRPRLGRHRLDLAGVIARLGPGGVTPR